MKGCMKLKTTSTDFTVDVDLNNKEQLGLFLELVRALKEPERSLWGKFLDKILGK